MGYYSNNYCLEPKNFVSSGKALGGRITESKDVGLEHKYIFWVIPSFIKSGNLS